MQDLPLIIYVDLLGVFVGALSGALVACRKPDFDHIGVGALALATGLGGGVLRDILLQQGPPLALRGKGYLLAAAAGALIGFFFGRNMLESRIPKVISWVDAFTLGNFAVSGTVLALKAGLSPQACVLVAERFLPNIVAGLLGWSVGVGVRALALAFGWKGPLPPGRAPSTG